MNRLRSILLLATAAHFISVGTPSIRAQDSPGPVQEYIAQRDGLDRDAAGRLDALEAVTDAELKAGRLKPEQADAQRQQISGLRRQLAARSDFVIKLPEKGSHQVTPALSKAWEELSTALERRKSGSEEKLSETREIIVRKALEVWRKAERADELNAPLESVREADTALSEGKPLLRRSTGPLSARRSAPTRAASAAGDPLLQQLVDLLSVSQRFLGAFAVGDEKAITASWNELSPARSALWAKVITPDEVRQWRQRFADKATAEVRALRAEADALVARSAGSKEILSVADKLTPATRRMDALKERTGFWSDPERDFLRSWAKVLECMEKGDWSNLQREVDSAGRIPEWFTAAGHKGYYAKLKEAAVGREAAEKAARARTEQEIHERLAKLSDAASALALADELPTTPQSDDAKNRSLIALQSDLRRLAALWNPQSGERQPGELLRDSGSYHPWKGDLRELGLKILREEIVRKTNSPELLAPPLNTLPLQTAVRNLGATLKEKQEWTRLHDLLASAVQGFGGSDLQQGEELRGLKAFLVGQNFERAEQFGDAVQSYRTVVSCIGPMVPVEAATERLKAIIREHPETRSSVPRAPSP